MSADRGEQLRARILDLVAEYHAEAFAPAEFRPGQSVVPVSGKVFDASELQALVDASLDFWLTTGRYAAEFEREFARWIGIRHAILVNSGSSANLLALTTLTAEELGERRLRPGDEVITAAAGFPTTVGPIIQNRLVPVFVDSTLPTYNADPDAIEAAVGPRTRAIMIAHTLGNPFDLDRIQAIAERHGLWLIEDTCDAVGSTWQGRKVGTFGDLATVSFYPAHHMTMGEGGAVLTKSPKLKKIVESFRDWGRDCWCEPGKDNTCGKRFEWQLGALPHGYDHKYTYSRIGYNLKLTDMQAAVGVAQLRKLDGFVARRRENFEYLRAALEPLADALDPPRADARLRPELVRVPHHCSPGEWLLAERDYSPPGGCRHQDAAAVRREPDPSARLCGHRVPHDREPRQRGPDHERHLLGRCLSRPGPSEAGLCRITRRARHPW